MPNWAFSAGDNGEWVLGRYFTINKYKLFHESRDSNSPDYNIIPTNEILLNQKTYRIDVVTRDVKQNGANLIGSGFIGFSFVGNGIGRHARISSEGGTHICDIFSPSTDNTPIRLFVSARAEATFDEISIREVYHYSDVDNNDDCDLPSIGFS